MGLLHIIKESERNSAEVSFQGDLQTTKGKALYKHIIALAPFYCQSILPIASNAVLEGKLRLYGVQTRGDLTPIKQMAVLAS